MEPQPLGPQRASPDARPAGLLDHSRDLWRGAPAWRLLIVSTAALFAASVATALLAPRDDQPTPIAAPLLEPAPPTAVVPPPPVAPAAPQAANPASPELQPQPAPNETACNYRGGSGGAGQGRVAGFLSRDQAAKLLALTQERTRARINPDYVQNVRVMITVPNGHRVIVILPAGLVVKPGDRVAFASGHRDWSMACGYVPNLIIGLLQPQ